VNARTAPGKELPYGAVGLVRGQQLHLGFPERQGHDGCAIDLFRWLRGQTEDIAVEGKGRFEVGHGNTNMGNAGVISQWLLR
jgi:hypothetical protein